MLENVFNCDTFNCGSVSREWEYYVINWQRHKMLFY